MVENTRLLGIGSSGLGKYYGQSFLDQTGGQVDYTYTALVNLVLGNKEKAIGTIHEAIRRLPPSEKYRYCEIRVLEVGVLAALGDYEEAIELLLKLNREYPEYGR